MNQNDALDQYQGKHRLNFKVRDHDALDQSQYATCNKNLFFFSFFFFKSSIKSTTFKTNMIENKKNTINAFILMSMLNNDFKSSIILNK